MPNVPEAISLVLDCDSAPDATVRIFQEAVHRDVAWQIALEQSMMDERVQNDEDELYKRHVIGPMTYCGFASVISDMVFNTSSRIRCNFDPGHPWDASRAAAILTSVGHANHEEFEDKWMDEVQAVVLEGPPDWTFDKLKAMYHFPSQPICGRGNLRSYPHLEL
ncbi:hypothetical protein V8F33_013617 [Rhypophila sp. PSN 637]